jgi:uncharacterized protein (UPF0335 family)
MSTEPHGIARDQLRAFIERVERVEEEIASLNTDKSDIYKEARAVGFDVKVLRKVVAKRKLETHVREEQDAIFDMYWDALYGAPVHVHTHARENIEENRRSDGGLSILTKHEDIRTAPVTAEEACRAPQGAAPVAGRPAEPANSLPTEGCGYAHTEGNATQSGVTAGETATNLPETATEVRSASTDAPETPGKQCTSVVSKDEAGQNLTGTHSDQPLTGGDHEVSGIASRERDCPTSNTGEGAANTALPAKSRIRPLCRNPGDTCPGYGRKHCRACEMAAAELEAAE